MTHVRSAAVLRLLVLSAGLASLSSAQGQAPIELTYWGWNAYQKPLVDRFNATHPGIKVTFNNVGNQGFYDKLTTAIKAKNAPDLAQVELQFLPTVVSTGGLVDLSKYGVATLRSRFEPWVWSQVNLGGATYAVPVDIGPVAMLYRADLFKKYGIQVPRTWTEYAQAAAKLHSANPNAYMANFATNDAGWFTALAWQAGARWFGIDGQMWKVSLNDAGTQKVARYWQDLIDRKLVKAAPAWNDAWYGDLQSGEVATWITAAWGTGFLQSIAPKTAGQWRVAPMPRWDPAKPAASNWGGSTTAVTTSSKHPKEAAQFAAWLGSNVQDSLQPQMKAGGIYPALKAGLGVADITAPTAFFGNQRVNQVFRDANKVVNVNFQWGPTINQVYRDLQDGFGDVANGKTTLPKVLDTVQATTVEGMKKQGFSVR